jgi:hypothetical protein
VASFIILSRNIEIKTDENKGCVRVSIGTPDILSEGFWDSFQDFWAGDLRSINVCGSLVNKSVFSRKTSASK